ncbi:cytochrome c biogenesis protein ResB [Methylophaga lonarensis]|nr:cytochrome c biogenesis protein ResB [Methylophaga lonarensis]
MSEKSSLKFFGKNSFPRRLLRFLGTMELAITLLITLAIASVIGTVLQQNQPYTDYLIKFGPFWFEVFESVGLYDVYSAPWFLVILTLLVISTAICVTRHTPSMLKDMRNLRTQVQRKSLASMKHNEQWASADAPATLAANFQQQLKDEGFRTRLTDRNGALLVSAMRGGINRLGYLLTHIAIVVICVGGLMDGNLPLKLAEWRGQIQIETRDLPLSQIPQESRLAVGKQAFRGSVSIPEGRSSEVVFLPMRDGYLVQALPFRIELEEFRIEHYDNGQPKSFESDLVIHDPELDEPLRQTIAVNHPLVHKGYAIYQASFADGGSILQVEAWPFDHRAGDPVMLDTKVFDNRDMRWGDRQYRLEMTNFRLFNINPDPTDEEPRRVRNYGPSIGFILRSHTGEATEYENYMFPIEREGRRFYLSGVRGSPSENFSYLHLPADANDGVEGFMEYLARLRDRELVGEIAQMMTRDALADLPEPDANLEESLQQTLMTLVGMFVRGGFDEVREFVENSLPEIERQTLAPAYLGMLREMLARVYFAGVEGHELDNTDNQNIFFLQDAVDAIGSLPRYHSPVFLMLHDYEHIQASGLQIARAPGQFIVYFGSVMLMAGLFILFYLPQRRLWVWLDAEGTGSRVLLAGMTNRNPRDFDGFFDEIQQLLKPDKREL